MPGRAGHAGPCAHAGLLRADRLDWAADAGRQASAASGYDGRGPPGGAGRGGSDAGPRRRHRGRAGPRRRAHDPRRAGRAAAGGWPGRGCGGAGRSRPAAAASPARWAPRCAGAATAARCGPTAGGRRRSAAESPAPAAPMSAPLGGDGSRRRPRPERRRDVRRRALRPASSGFRGVRHAGDGRLFDRRVVDFDFRGPRDVGRLGSATASASPARGWRRPHARPGGWPWRP